MSTNCCHVRITFTVPNVIQELTIIFERRVAAYQVAVAGEVSFSEAF